MDVVPLCRTHHEAVHDSYPRGRSFSGMWQHTRHVIGKLKSQQNCEKLGALAAKSKAPEGTPGTTVPTE
jgi:hypothetical protein